MIDLNHLVHLVVDLNLALLTALFFFFLFFRHVEYSVKRSARNSDRTTVALKGLMQETVQISLEIQYNPRQRTELVIKDKHVMNCRPGS